MNEEQIKLLKEQNLFLKIILGCMGVITLVMIIAAFVVLPKVGHLLNQASNTIMEVDELLAQTSESIAEVDVVVKDLQKANLPELIDETKELIVNSQETITTAMDKINEMDIEKLNKAVSDLQGAVSPLAKLFGRK